MALGLPAAAQQVQPGPSTGTKPDPSATGLLLSKEPFRMDSVGLAMNLPEGAIAQSTRVGDKLAVQLTPPPPDSSWLVNIQTPQSTNEKLTAEEVATDVLNKLLASVGVLDRKVTNDGKLVEKVSSTSGTILEPVRGFEITGIAPEHRRPAARFYVRLPRGEKEPAVIRGYTVFRVAPGRFVTFDLATTEPVFAASKLAYETTVGTVRFTDPALQSATRGAAVEAGIDLIMNLSPNDYEAAIASLKDQYYRLYKPATTGADNDATEIAYRRVRATKGMRGEINPGVSPAGLKGTERQLGYLVRIDARYLQGQTVVDSIGIYFMTPDRKEEAWMLQMAVREPGRRDPAKWVEIGARDQLSMNVTISGTGQEEQTWRPVVPEAGYITMVEGFLLPQLMIGSGAKSVERAFYTYQSKYPDHKVRLRRDRLAQVSDRNGAWKLETRPSEEEDPQVSVYNEQGNLVQIVFPDTSVMAPTTLQRLADIWRNKNLPME
jgi:hypothetical protein